MCQKIIHGTPLSKVSHHWKLLSILKSLPSIVSRIFVNLISHVRRDANRLVDYFSNQRVTSLDKGINTPLTNQIPLAIYNDYITLAQQDLQRHPNGVSKE